MAAVIYSCIMEDAEAERTELGIVFSWGVPLQQL